MEQYSTHFLIRPANQAQVYILDLEALKWHKGNTAERMLIALGSWAAGNQPRFTTS